MCLCSNSRTQGPLLHASSIETELDSNHIPHLHLAGVVHYILWIHDVRQRGRGGDGCVPGTPTAAPTIVLYGVALGVGHS